jgi:hypothetical protein
MSLCKHAEYEFKILKAKKNLKKPSLYLRSHPNKKLSKNPELITKKAKFFGNLMYQVLIAGGAPNWFRYEVLRDVTVEELLNQLFPNDVSVIIKYNK